MIDSRRVGPILPEKEREGSMDLNQQDRVSLNANMCPDCGGTIGRRANNPWCRSCDVWFEFDNSGWIIRNSDAARYLDSLETQGVDADSKPEDPEAAFRDQPPATIEFEPTRRDPQRLHGDTPGPAWRVKGRKADQGHWLMPAKQAVSPPGYLELPVYLYRWLIDP